MNARDDNFPAETLDAAMSQRLAKLRAMPVDTTNLDRRLRETLPAKESTMSRWRLSYPMRIAAALLIATGIVGAAIFFTRETPAIASPVELVRMHDDAIAGRGHMVRVNSLEEASRVLAQQWSAKPDLPEVSGAEVMACCLHEMGKARLAAVTLNAGEAPVTMAVADAGDLRSPKSPTLRRNGIDWHVQSAGDVNMVSARRQGRWICLMGRLPTEKLMDLAESLEF